MKIRDIVYRDIVNLTNCDQEPIHIPGSIQPHGFLLGLRTTDGVIDFCSESIREHLGVGPEQALGKPVDALITQRGNCFAQLQEAVNQPQSPLSFEFGNQLFSCFAHISGQTLIAEFEPTEQQALQLSELYNLNLESINILRSAHSLKKLCQDIADQVKKITGYDRVMIYRFDEQYNGEVFSESKEESLEPFLGLHYPHTDIPAQARQLYIKNLLRVIADVNYTPSPLYTIDDTPGKNLDLGMASLRSVSPIHIEYLQNIGVRATLTISLLNEGRLWGLIACHHYRSEKYLSAYTRVSTQLLGHLLSSQINVRENAEEYEQAQLANIALEKLLSEPAIADREQFDTLVRNPALLDVCRAAGVAMMVDGKVYKAGLTPGDEIIIRIAGLVAEKSFHGLFSTHHLSALFEETAAHCASASGILFFALEGTGSNCIIWFRPESLDEVHWAGDPTKAIIKNEKGLSPRNSFELWRETVKCQSRRWSSPEITAATTFAHSFQKNIHLLLLGEEESRYRELSRQLKEANDELENLNWISTHDLREPLRKIQIFSSRILSDDQRQLSAVVEKSITKMNESANRMQQLITDITAYSKLRHKQGGLVEVDLNTIVKETVADLAAEVNESEQTINVTALPVVKGIRLLLHQLFVNLIRNSIKFRKPDQEPVIEIIYAGKEHYPGNEQHAQLYHRIDVKDNGIGLDNNYRDDIFQVFTRLHNQQEYTGTGIGLALCRQVMQIHNGYIAADGEEGVGSTFSLFFPV